MDFIMLAKELPDDLLTRLHDLLLELRTAYDMGRPRLHNTHLPRRVVERHGAYFYITPKGRWKRLARSGDESAMYAALSLQLADPDQDTMNTLFDLYEQRVLPGKAVKTRKDQGAQLVVLRAWLGVRDPDTIESSEIAEALDDAKHKIAANRRIALLSSVFTYGVRWGKCKANPCLRVRRNPETPRKVYITSTRFWAVWTAAPPHIGLAMELSLITGQRMTDVLGLRWADVHEDGVLFTQNKTGVTIVIESTEWLLDVLARCREISNHSTHVLVNTLGKPWSTHSFKMAWQRFMRTRADRFQFRDIRKKSGNDGTTGAHLGNDIKTFEKWYQLRPLRASALSGKEDKHFLDSVLDSERNAR